MIEWSEKPTPVLLAPGSGGDPVHLRSPTRQAIGNLDLDRLPLSQQLRDDLRGWERLRQRAWAAADTPAGEHDLHTWAEQARLLLPRLRQELGPGYDVQFIGNLQDA